MATATPKHRSTSSRDSVASNDIPDPFDISPSPTKSTSHRFSAKDTTLFASYNAASPTQAKRAIEAHIADTDRRMQEAAKLEATLRQQKEQLAETLKDVDGERSMREIDPNLKQRLVDLEKEVNEVGKDSVRALLLKGRNTSSDFRKMPGTPHTLSADAAPSPSKPQALNKHRSTGSGNTNDPQLMMDISNSLLVQVRNLQAALAEKELALKRANDENTTLHGESETIRHRLRSLDESEQKFKDENWALETQLQDLMTQAKDAVEREQKLHQLIAQSKEEKSTSEREHDDLKILHNRLNEEHDTLKKQHDAEVSAHRRNLASGDDERELMQKKIDELTTQNIDLAKAVTFRGPSDAQAEGGDGEAEGQGELDGQRTPENSAPPSPVKGTPRHGALESETLRSSLTHAHRMIQNLKNNIHREKTEKLELKRLLQDARDEVETRRLQSGPGTGTSIRRKANQTQDGFKKPARPDKLGAAKKSEEWEEYEGSPTRRPTEESESTDAFETADERRNSTSTETDYHTGAESIADETSDAETERGFGASVGSRHTANRASFQSTASDETFDVTSQPAITPKNVRHLRDTSETPNRDSPASIGSAGSQPWTSRNLAAELDGLDSSSIGTDTPSRSIRAISESPNVPRHLAASPLSSPPNITRKPAMVDSGTLTDPWEPQTAAQGSQPATPDRKSLAKSSGVGSVFGRFKGRSPREQKSLDVSRSPSVSTVVSNSSRKAVENVEPEVPPTRQPVTLVMSSIVSQSTEPLEPVPKPQASVADSATSMTPSRQTDQATAMTPSKASSAGTTMTPARNNDAGTSVTPQVRNSTSPVTEKDGDTPSSSKRGQDFISSTKAFVASLGRSSRASSQPPQAVEQSQTPRRSQDGLDLTPDGRSRPASVKSNASRKTQIGPDESELQSLATASQNGSYASTDADPFDTHTPIKVAESKDKTPASARSVASSQPQTPAGASYTSVETPASADRTLTPGQVSSSPSQRSAAQFSGRSMSLTNSVAMSDLALKRRSSPGADSSRAKSGSPMSSGVPPLPPDHREVIAAAASRTNSLMNMPPPSLTPSSQRNSQIRGDYRPRTANSIIQQSPLQTRSTLRSRAPSLAGRSDATRRSSVSSFASDIDFRFNAPYQLYGYGANEYEMMAGGMTDPRMIAAITQTMIGEFLWKYTRKTGRGELSDNRHRRFFWIHPYTRTLYWSTQDPSATRRPELKAKSVAIEAVRVVTDNNPMPPGLYLKSIVVVTPGRSIKFTAPTSQRHETWFNALSYLLLRNQAEREDQVTQQAANLERSNTMTSINSDDVSEFSVGYNPTKRSSSRVSRQSFGGTVPSAVGNYSTPMLTQRPRSRGREQAQPSLAVRQVPVSVAGSASGRVPVPAGATAGPSRVYSNTSDYRVPGTTSPAEVDADGFKKPKMRPLSMNPANSGKTTPSEPATSAAETDSPSQSQGRLRSITSRLRPPSFASLSKRGRSVGPPTSHKKHDSQSSTTRTSIDGRSETSSHKRQESSAATDQ